jgi:tetratricopeptide (TPR) repeat protein
MDAEPEVTWKAYVVLGYLHFEEEQWEPALRAYSAALSRMPPEPPIDEVCFNLGQCYERLGRWVEAQVFFRRITERYLFSKIAVKAQRRLDIRPTHFAVQCGAFRQLDNAERMQADLEQKGLLAYIREERRGSTTLHIVLVGRYATYDEGQRGLATVQQYVSDALLWP